MRPSKYENTNSKLYMVIMVATVALTSVGTTSPWYTRHQSHVFTVVRSHFTIWLTSYK